jgi:hypothetical protein
LLPAFSGFGPFSGFNFVPVFSLAAFLSPVALLFLREGGGFYFLESTLNLPLKHGG